jgi:hypothetical protein
MPKLRPFLRRSSDDPLCHLIVGIGVAWGKRGGPEPSGTAALWLFSHWRLHSRTSRAEHYKRCAFWVEVQLGRRLARVVLEPKDRPRFEYSLAVKCASSASCKYPDCACPRQ